MISEGLLPSLATAPNDTALMTAPVSNVDNFIAKFPFPDCPNVYCGCGAGGVFDVCLCIKSAIVVRH